MVFGFKKKRAEYDINDLQSLKSHIENKFSNPIEENLRSEIKELKYQLNVEKENNKKVQRDLLNKESKISELEKEIETLKIKKPIRTEVKKVFNSKDKKPSKISDLKSKLEIANKRIQNG